MFCTECGRISPCKWHFGKEIKPKKTRQVKFSGDSKFRQENGQFQSKVGR